MLPPSLPAVRSSDDHDQTLKSSRTSNVFSVEAGFPAVSVCRDHRIEQCLSRTACCLNTTLNKAMDCALIAT
jgi:hypothetical protein